MFFDIRLWQFTRGVRLRIAATVVMGVLASLAGMGRLALLGWLLTRVFAGDTFSELLLPFALVAAVMVLRGWIEHTRAMVAHRTAAMVQLVLRKRLYAKVSAGMRRAEGVLEPMHDLPAVIDREAFVRDCRAGDVAAKAFEGVTLMGLAAPRTWVSTAGRVANRNRSG